MKPSKNAVYMSGYDKFCNDVQLKYIQAVRSHGNSENAAAKFLKKNRQSLRDCMASLKKQAALKGFSPEHDMTHTVPEGFAVKGTSTLYGDDGKLKAQWVKTTRSEEQYIELMKSFALALGEDVRGLAAACPPPTHRNDDLLVVIPIGDPHVGMRAWSLETGTDFDLAIAEKLSRAAIDRLITSGPEASTALILNLGDHFHADSQGNTTTKGTPVDVDGRWAKVQKVGLMTMIYCIDRALQKYQNVIFRINAGNHDQHSSYGLALMLSCYYHNEPRATIDLSPAKAWYYQFGKVLIGSTHGDTMKGGDLMAVMACDQPTQWGETTTRVWYCGHVHHHDSKEYRGGIVEYFRTLAPSDAWHKGQGYRSGRDICLIVHHKEHGEIERHRVDVSMIENTLQNTK